METLIIAGMHRSGTSLVTQWLSRCGLEIGRYCVGAGPSNLDGHFEDKEFLRLHEDVLADNNLPETGLTDRKLIEMSDYDQRRLEDLFSLKNDFCGQWGMKDPRTCLFLPYYADAFPENKYLFIFRDFKSVVSSLLQREFKDIERKYLGRKLFQRFVWKNFRRERRLKRFYNENASKYLKIWIAYNEQIKDCLSALKTENYLLLPYTILKTDDVKIFQYLHYSWKFDLDYVAFKDVFKKELISPVLSVEEFIADKSLIETASNLEKDLQIKFILQDLNIYAESF